MYETPSQQPFGGDPGRLLSLARATGRKQSMRYNGGKASCAGEIAAIINAELAPGESYWEPFVGACSVIQRIRPDVTRVGSDADASIISLLLAIRSGWVPPDSVSEDAYRAARLLPDSDPMHGFCKYGLSFGGKPWGGYARSGSRNYASNAKNSLLRQAPILSKVDLIVQDYRAGSLEFDAVYCDPPYEGTTAVGCGGRFDHAAFWDWARRIGGRVFVSELSAPPDFKCVWEKPLSDGLGRRKLTERLFVRA